MKLRFEDRAPWHENHKRWKSSEAHDFVNSLDTFATGLLVALSNFELDTKDLIIRGFIARSIASLNSIHACWKESSYQDCWILFRSLLERRLLLSHLSSNEEFETFEEWSFIQQYEAQNRIRSDTLFGPEIEKGLYEPSTMDKDRYKKLKRRNVRWVRPKAEDIAKKIGLRFLYKYGYDHASSHVHPMANEGSIEYQRLCFEPSAFADSEHGYFLSRNLDMALSNSILIFLMLVQEALNQSDFLWRRIVYDFLENSLKDLGSPINTHEVTLLKLASSSPSDWLSRPSET